MAKGQHPPRYTGYVPLVFLFGCGALFGYFLPLDGLGWIIGAVFGYFMSRMILRLYFERRLAGRTSRLKGRIPPRHLHP